MRIILKKLGTTLTSRQIGKESYLGFRPNLDKIKRGEIVEVNFEGVTTFAPAWGDEFLSPLLKKYGKKLVLVNTGNNPSVKITLEILSSLGGKNFRVIY